MSFDDLRRAFSIIEAHAHESDFEGPKDDGLIGQAEQHLGVSLPPTYREFLRRYGAGDILGHEFYGLLGDNFENSGVPDAVWLTGRHRATAGLPEQWVVIYSRGDGGYYVLDCSRIDDGGESPVVLWYPPLSSEAAEADVAYGDFGEFLKRTLDEATSEDRFE